MFRIGPKRLGTLPHRRPNRPLPLELPPSTSPPTLVTGFSRFSRCPLRQSVDLRQMQAQS